MFFKEIYIDGFGIFHNVKIAGIPKGFSLFLGDNEAGKTTLLSFIRGILFGFPDRRTSENQYPAQNGGEYGGRISMSNLNMDNKFYVIERRKGPRGGKITVTSPDGSSDEERFQHLLGSATKDLYSNIFAFSLSELQRFEALNTDAVNTAIYSAGAGLGDISISEIDKKFDKKIEGIFKPRGSKARINTILKKLGEIQQSLKGHFRDIEKYGGLQKTIADTNKKIEKMEKETHALNLLWERSKTLISVYDDWTALCSAEREINNIEKIEYFPAKGVVRIEQLIAAKKEVDLQAKRLISEKKILRERITQKRSVWQYTIFIFIGIIAGTIAGITINSETGIFITGFSIILGSAAIFYRNRGIKEDSERLELEIETTEKRLRAIEQEINLLLKEAGASDYENFLKRGELHGKYQKLSRATGDLTLAIEKRCGHGKHLEEAKTELKKSSPDRLKAGEREYHEKIELLNKEIKENIFKSGDIERQLHQIEAGEETARLNFRKQVLIEQLTDAVKEWNTYVIAKTLLSQARERYEKERQPEVIKEAKCIFKKITGSKYINLFAPLGERRLHVIDSNNAIKDLSELSRGTAEQLYLALRFGSIKEFARRQEALPVVMDDILVNFDPLRAEAALNSILELAGTHQILMFTCHPETVNMVHAMNQTASVFHLKNGAVDRVS